MGRIIESYNLGFVLNGNHSPFISDVMLRDALNVFYGVLPYPVKQHLRLSARFKAVGRLISAVPVAREGQKCVARPSSWGVRGQAPGCPSKAGQQRLKKAVLHLAGAELWKFFLKPAMSKSKFQTA
jgi:hypothetical protein